MSSISPPEPTTLIRLEAQDRVTRVVASGDFDSASAARLEALLRGAISTSSEVELDVQAMGIVTSSAIRSLAAAKSLSESVGTKLYLVAPPAHVSQILEAVGLEFAVEARTLSDRDSTAVLSAMDRTIAQGVLHGRESVVMTDCDLAEPGPTITFVNRAFTDLTGYSAAEAIGKSPRILQGPLTERTVLDRLIRNMRSGRPFTGETVNYRKDGTPFVMNWRIVAIKSDKGGPDQLLAMQSDGTEQRRLSRFQTALTYLDSQATAIRNSTESEKQQAKRTIEAMLAGQVALLEDGVATARIEWADGSVATFASTGSDEDVEQARLYFDQVAVSPISLSNREGPSALLLPLMAPRRGVVGVTRVVLGGMHRDRLRLADPHLHEALAQHALAHLP